MTTTAGLATLAPRATAGLAASTLAIGAALVRAGLVVARRSSRRRITVGDPVDRRLDTRLRALVALAPPPPRAVVRRLRRAGLGARAADSTWRVLVGVAAAAVIAVTLAVGPLAAVLMVVLAGLVAVLVLVAVGDRAAVLVDRELPGVLSAVASGVRSGASLPTALGEGASRARGPVVDDLATVTGSLAAGRAFVEAVEQWVQARPTSGVRMAAAALTLAAETGGAGARTIDGVAATLRDRLAVERELAALSSQARASAVVVGVAPVGFVALTAASDPGVWSFFLATPTGLACLAAGCLLDAVGAGWMIVIARGAR